MKILIIGSGGREHALAYRIKQSPLVSELYCAPGNGGIGQDIINVTLNGDAEIIAFCKDKKIDLVVIGPEAPLVSGLADELRANGIATFGPSALAAQLEGSKAFTKNLCRKYNIPTASYGHFDTKEAALAYIEKHGAPIVVKADGLAAGKGVVVAMVKEQALDAIEDCFSGRFGDAGTSVVIEEFMEGEEASFFAFSDGEHVIEFGSAQDHKRVGDNDTGPNTGGMGTFTPVAAMTESMRKTVMDTIIKPTVAAMITEGMPFKGVLFAGLMLTKDGPKLIEYNARFGDPETQALMMRLKSDLVPVLLACAQGQLKELCHSRTLSCHPHESGGLSQDSRLRGNDSEIESSVIEFHKQAAVCVVMAAKGYPGNYHKNTVIEGLDALNNMPDVKVFHAGTALKDGKMMAIGGRVLGVTALGATIADARAQAYAAVQKITWKGGFCRSDIAKKAAEK